MKEVLLVSDMVGVGKVALSAMIPLLSVMEVNLNYLPTAMVSNNFAHGKADVFDMTESMGNIVDIWDDLGFQFDIITTGIIMSSEQVDIVRKLVDNQEEKPFIIVDPIMGDEGSVYPGLDDDIVHGLKKMVPIADVLLPNATEAALLLDEQYIESEMSTEIIEDWIGRLRDKGAKSIAITSVKIDGKHYVYGYEDGKGIIKVEYEHVPLTFGGTGDIFSSLVTGEIAKSKTLKESIEYATTILTEMVYAESKKEHHEIMEIPIAEHLHRIK